MNNQELFKLLKNSKVAQVASPLSPKLRRSTSVPTHQIIQTPQSSAHRSNYGLKTSLPRQVGRSHVVFNDLDNFKGMPDVEKYSGQYYNLLKFKESGMVLKRRPNEPNPLFPSEVTKSKSFGSLEEDGNILSAFNLKNDASSRDVLKIIRKNPELHTKFQNWLLENNPEAILINNPANVERLLRQFIGSDVGVSKNKVKVSDFTRKLGKTARSSIASKVQGTAGFSYSQKGRLSNTPNGVKYNIIAPGRLVDDREAAIGGFVSQLSDRSVTLQSNYSKSYPGKHSRQFVMPFKLREAELNHEGKVRISSEGVIAGSWMNRMDIPLNSKNSFTPANPNFDNADARNSDNSSLENLLGILSSNTNN